MVCSDLLSLSLVDELLVQHYVIEGVKPLLFDVVGVAVEAV